MNWAGTIAGPFYICSMQDDVFTIDKPKDFARECVRTFRYQYENNPVYHEFVNLIGIQPEQVNHPDAIPFLPISFFKTHSVWCGTGNPEITFTSSGTSGMKVSQHPVASLALYEKSFYEGFKFFYGNPEKYCLLALLPSYLERQGSSLVYMANKLIQLSSYAQSGFYLHNLDQLSETLAKCQKDKTPTILLGVSYALLDLADQYPQDLSSIIIMETGGMKGNRPEIPKLEMHRILSQAFQVPTVHSEYGMTELLSQAYSTGQGSFNTPPWMQLRIRDPYNPLAQQTIGKPGGINIIDLANLHSCSFIQTDDLGKQTPNGSTQIMGRLKSSQIRGCNLLIQ